MIVKWYIYFAECQVWGETVRHHQWGSDFRVMVICCFVMNISYVQFQWYIKDNHIDLTWLYYGIDCSKWLILDVTYHRHIVDEIVALKCRQMLSCSHGEFPLPIIFLEDICDGNYAKNTGGSNFDASFVRTKHFGKEITQSILLHRLDN